MRVTGYGASALTVLAALAVAASVSAAPPDTTGTREPEQIKSMLSHIGREGEVGRKNPKLAMLYSAIFPGMGQLYNGRRIKVGVAAGAFSFYATNTWLSWRRAQRFKSARDRYPVGTTAWLRQDIRYDFWKEDARTFLWWTGASWLIILLDSWIDAHLFDIRAYTPPPLEGGGQTTSFVTMEFSF